MASIVVSLPFWRFNATSLNGATRFVVSGAVPRDVARV